jgi:hypothetical protein
LCTVRLLQSTGALHDGGKMERGEKWFSPRASTAIAQAE